MRGHSRDNDYIFPKKFLKTTLHFKIRNTNTGTGLSMFLLTKTLTQFAASTVRLIVWCLFLTQVSKASSSELLSSPPLNGLELVKLTPRHEFSSVFEIIHQSALNGIIAEPNDPSSTSGQTYIVPNQNSLKSKVAAIMFGSNANIIKLEDTNLIIYYDEDAQMWYLHQYNKPGEDIAGEATNRIPVSWCLDMTDGNGGFISPSIEVELASGGGSSITGGYAGIGQFKGDIFKVAFGVSLAASVKFVGGMTCNVKAGQYGRVFIRPYVFAVPAGRRVPVVFKKTKGIIEKGEWETTESYNRYWVRPPMVECLVGPDSSLCTGFSPT